MSVSAVFRVILAVRMIVSANSVRASIGGAGDKSKPCVMVLVAGAVFVPSLRQPLTSEIAMSTCVFVQLRCRPGKTYKVAQEIIAREIHSELYSTSGDFDLMMKLYIPEDQDVGKYISDQLLDIKGIKRSLTTLTFKAF